MSKKYIYRLKGIAINQLQFISSSRFPIPHPVFLIPHACSKTVNNSDFGDRSSLSKRVFL
jgi:hypothetical protein